MNIFVISLIIICLILYTILPSSSSPPTEHFIDRDFFIEKPLHLTVSCAENDRDVLDKIILDSHTYSTVDPDYVMDISVPEGYLFLGNLLSRPIILLVPNTLNIFDFSELARANVFRLGLTPNTKAVWLELSKLLDPQAVARITTYDLTDEEAVEKYDTDINALLIAPKLSVMPYLRTITDRVPSHLLRFDQINAGNYFVLDNEKPFYDAHPQFQKQLLDLVTFKQHYPLLTTIKRTPYLPTFKINYILSCHKRVPDRSVKKTLAQILRLQLAKYFGNHTIVDISNNTTSAPDHHLVHQAYTKIHSIHTIRR